VGFFAAVRAVGFFAVVFGFAFALVAGFLVGPVLDFAFAVILLLFTN
jgi:hypothetical protein